MKTKIKKLGLLVLSMLCVACCSLGIGNVVAKADGETPSGFTMASGAYVGEGTKDGKNWHGIQWVTNVSDEFYNTAGGKDAEWHTLIGPKSVGMENLTVENIAAKKLKDLQSSAPVIVGGTGSFTAAIKYDNLSEENFQKAAELELIARAYVKKADGSIVYADEADTTRCMEGVATAAIVSGKYDSYISVLKPFLNITSNEENATDVTKLEGFNAYYQIYDESGEVSVTGVPNDTYSVYAGAKLLTKNVAINGDTSLTIDAFYSNLTAEDVGQYRNIYFVGDNGAIFSRGVQYVTRAISTQEELQDTFRVYDGYYETTENGSEVTASNGWVTVHTNAQDGYYILLNDIVYNGTPYQVLDTEVAPYMFADPQKQTTKAQTLNKALKFYDQGSNHTGGLTGTFDGKGYTLQNFTIYEQGLFGLVTGGTIQNVNIENVALIGRAGQNQAVLGLTLMGATLENVSISTSQSDSYNYKWDDTNKVYQDTLTKSYSVSAAHAFLAVEIGGETTMNNCLFSVPELEQVKNIVSTNAANNVTVNDVYGVGRPLNKNYWPLSSGALFCYVNGSRTGDGLHFKPVISNTYLVSPTKLGYYLGGSAWNSMAFEYDTNSVWANAEQSTYSGLFDAEGNKSETDTFAPKLSGFVRYNDVDAMKEASNSYTSFTESGFWTLDANGLPTWAKAETSITVNGGNTTEFTLYTMEEVAGETFATSMPFVASATKNGQVVTPTVVWTEGANLVTLENGVLTANGVVGTAVATISYEDVSITVTVTIAKPVVNYGETLKYSTTDDILEDGTITWADIYADATSITAADKDGNAYVITDGVIEYEVGGANAPVDLVVTLTGDAYDYEVNVTTYTKVIYNQADLLEALGVKTLVRTVASGNQFWYNLNDNNGYYILGNDIVGDGTIYNVLENAVDNSADTYKFGPYLEVPTSWNPTYIPYPNRLNFAGTGHRGGFTGVFDGDGHTITGITIRNNGLFGMINGATIKNVNIENNNVYADRGVSRGMLGYSMHNAVLDNVRVAGMLSDDHYGWDDTNKVPTDTLTQTSSNAWNRGFLAYIGGGADSTFTNCIFECYDIEGATKTYAGNFGSMFGYVCGGTDSPFADTNMTNTYVISQYVFRCATTSGAITTISYDASNVVYADDAKVKPSKTATNIKRYTDVGTMASENNFDAFITEDGCWKLGENGIPTWIKSTADIQILVNGTTTTNYTLYTETVDGTECVNTIDFAVTATKDGKAVKPSITWVEGANLVTLENGKLTSTGTAGTAKAVITYGLVSKEVTITVLPAIETIELAVNGGNNTQFDLFTTNTFLGETFVNSTNFVVTGTRNGKEITPTVTWTEGADLVTLADGVLTSNGVAGTAVATISYGDTSMEVTVTINKATVTYKDAVMYSTMDDQLNDGTLTWNNILADATVTAVGTNGTEYVVTDGAIELDVTKTTGPVNLVVTLSTAYGECDVNVTAYTKVIYNEADLLDALSVKTLVRTNASGSGKFYALNDNNGYYILANDIVGSGNAYDVMAKAVDNSAAELNVGPYIDYSTGGWSLTYTAYAGAGGRLSGHTGGFTGIFDGNGHTISGITIKNNGLFGMVKGGTIKNVNVENNTIYANFYYNRGMLAYSMHNAVLENVRVAGAVSDDYYAWDATANEGAGAWKETAQENTSGNGFARGLIAYAVGGDQTTFTNCIFELTDVEGTTITTPRGYGLFGVIIMVNSTAANNFADTNMTNTYVISNYALYTNEGKVYDAANANAEATKTYANIKRYVDATAMKDAGNNYDAFSSNYWFMNNGVPTWKTGKAVLTINGGNATEYTLYTETVDGTECVNSIDFVVAGTIDGESVQPTITWTEGADLVTLEGGKLTSTGTEGVAKATISYGEVSMEVTITVQPAIETIELAVNGGNNTQFDLFTTNTFLGETFVNSTEFVVTGTRNGKEITPTVTWTEGADLVTLADGVLTSNGVAGTAVATISYGDTSMEVTVTINKATATYKDAVMYSTMDDKLNDGTLTWNNILADATATAVGTDGTEYVVTDGAIELNVDKTTGPVNLVVTLSTAYGECDVNVTAYTKVIYNQADLLDALGVKTLVRTVASGNQMWYNLNDNNGYYILGGNITSDGTIYNVMANAVDNSADTYKFGPYLEVPTNWNPTYTPYPNRFNFAGTGHRGGFTGVFDGAGHTISGLTIRNDGLFGMINGGTIKNVNIENNNVYANIGISRGTLAYSMYDAVLTNVRVAGSLSDDYYKWDSTNNVPTDTLAETSDNAWNRGLLAYIGAGANTTFTNCIFECYEIEGTTKKYATNYGSLFGYLCGGTSTPFGDTNVTNTYVISQYAFRVVTSSGAVSAISYDASNVDYTGAAITPAKSSTTIKRYTDVATMASENNFDAFITEDGCWFMNNGIPTWKTGKAVLSINGGNVTEYTLATANAGEYVNSIAFAVAGTVDGESVQPTITWTEGADLVTLEGGKLTSTGTAGVAKATISYGEVSMDVTVTIEKAVVEYAEKVMYSTMDGKLNDGTLTWNDILADATVSAVAENGTEYAVTDGVIELDVTKTTGPVNLVVTLDTDNIIYTVNATAYTKVIYTQDDLRKAFLIDEDKGSVITGYGQISVKTVAHDGYYILAQDIVYNGTPYNVLDMEKVPYLFADYYIQTAKAQALNSGNGAKTYFYVESTAHTGGLTGIFDGNGYSIKNFVIAENGLFGMVNGGTIKNVNIENVSFVGRYGQIQVALGATLFNATLENVNISTERLTSNYYAWDSTNLVYKDTLTNTAGGCGAPRALLAITMGGDTTMNNCIFTVPDVDARDKIEENSQSCWPYSAGSLFCYVIGSKKTEKTLVFNPTISNTYVISQAKLGYYLHNLRADKSAYHYDTGVVDHDFVGAESYTTNYSGNYDANGNATDTDTFAPKFANIIRYTDAQAMTDAGNNYGSFVPTEEGVTAYWHLDATTGLPVWGAAPVVTE